MITLASLLLSGSIVALPAEARVRGTELFVGDVATVTGDDPAEVARVSAVSLGYAPAPGYTRVLQPQRVQQLLSGAVRDVEVRVRADGALRVSPETAVVTADRIVAAAREALEARTRELTGGPATEVSAQPVEAVAALEVPAGARGHALEASLVSARPVLTRAVRAGEELTADMLQGARVPRAAQGPEHLDRVAVVGNTARRDLAAGAPLTDVDLDRPTLIERGDTVMLEVRKGNVLVRVVSVAQQSGRLGDAILVERPAVGRRRRAPGASPKRVRMALARNR